MGTGEESSERRMGSREGRVELLKTAFVYFTGTLSQGCLWCKPLMWQKFVAFGLGSMYMFC